MAAVVVQGNRREDERHRAGGGDGAGDGQAVQIKAEGVEVFLREFHALAEAHVGGADNGERSLAAFGEVGKGRAVVKEAVEFFGKQIAAPVLRTGEARQVGQGQELAQHGALQVLLQKFALETRHGVFAVQTEVGGKYRAAGDAVDEVGFFQKARGFTVAGDGRRRQHFQHAVAKGGRARATAGEEEDEKEVVVLLVVEDVLQAVTAAVIDVVDGRQRLVFDMAAGSKEHGEEEQEGFHRGSPTGFVGEGRALPSACQSRAARMMSARPPRHARVCVRRAKRVSSRRRRRARCCLPW